MTSEEILSWDARFSGDEYLFGTEPNRFLAREAARIEQGGRVLAIADGEGRNGVWLAQQGFAVHSIEGSPAAVAKAIALATGRGVPVVASMSELVPGSIFTEQVDILDWTWPIRAYEAVVGIFIQFIGPEDRPRIFTAIAGALVPHGVLLLEGYAPRQLEYGTGGPRSLAHLYDMALLSTAFPTLSIEELREYDAEVDEGAQHNGMSALIDLIATAG
ncbi:MAG: SAM-dependent methyltransferase [Actinomycetes bacterium]